MSSSIILNIPREIRNQVYEYLHQPVRVTWEVREQTICCTSLEVDQAPITNDFLVCARMKEEYLESRIFKNLAATIRTAPTDPTWEDE